MKKSLLLLVSDSWGAGAEIEKIEDNLYVNHLQQYLGFDKIKNLSTSGQTNDSIYQLTISSIFEYKDKFNLFVLVGWTSPERKLFSFNRLYEGGKSPYNFNHVPGMIYQEDKDYGCDSPKQKSDLKHFLDLYNKYCWSVEESLERWSYQMVTLHRLLISYDIKHLFFNNFYPYGSMYDFFKDSIIDNVMQSDVDEFFGHDEEVKDLHLYSEPLKSGDELNFNENEKILISQINKKNIFPNTLLNVLRDKYENKERPPMKVSSVKPNNPTLASGGHPNEFGHIEIANMLYNYIKEID